MLFDLSSSSSKRLKRQAQDQLPLNFDDTPKKSAATSVEGKTKSETLEITFKFNVPSSNNQNFSELGTIMTETQTMQEACLMEPTVQWSQRQAARSTILRTIITDELLEKVPITYSAAKKLKISSLCCVSLIMF